MKVQLQVLEIESEGGPEVLKRISAQASFPRSLVDNDPRKSGKAYIDWVANSTKREYARQPLTVSQRFCVVGEDHPSFIDLSGLLENEIGEDSGRTVEIDAGDRQEEG